MARQLLDNFSGARDFFHRADQILGFAVSELCRDGSQEELTRTTNAQPALLATSLAWLEVLCPGLAAGHSLGEFAAWVASGALSAAEALRLVRRRAELMEAAAAQRPGAMTAIIGLEAEKVAQICSQAAARGIVVPANLNCPGQVVISGEKEPLQQAAHLAKQAGAKVLPLAVSGGFHSPLMQEAATAFAHELEQVTVQNAVFPVVPNAWARPVQDRQEIKAAMAAQMTSPVLWEASLRQLIALGAKAFVEVGPGQVLTGMVKRIDSGVEAVAVSVENLEQLTTLCAAGNH